MANPLIKMALNKAMQGDAIKLDKGAEQPLVMLACPKCGYEGPEEEFQLETPEFEEDYDDDEDEEEDDEF